jgi:predicted enzyme related to lactoylglutathione lyase
MTTIDFGQVVIDCTDAGRLAKFWSALVGRPLVEGASPFFAVVPPSPDRSSPALMFLAGPEPRAGKNRLHLDLTSDDAPAAVTRAVELGAAEVGAFAEWGTTWTTLADPEGNVFDIGAPHE